MAYLGQTPAFSPLTAADISDGIVTAAKIANETGTGEVVFSISPTITTPLLDNIKLGYTTTATAAGTTTLTVSSTYQQFFTGSTTQTIVLPVVSTLVTGLGYFIQNNSSGVLTVQSSGLNTITTIAAGVAVLCTCISTSGTSAASWDADIHGLGTTSALPAANGGTGVVNNAAMTVTGSGNFAYTRTLTAATNVTFPTTGTLSTLAGSETLTNKTLTAPTIASANLTTALTLAGAAGTNGQVLTSAGSGLPSWTTISSSPTIVRSARTSNTILAAADASTLIDITSGTFSQTFTAAATLGSGWFCYIRNSGTGVITLDPNASEQIDGLTSYTMYPNECRLVQCTGTAFFSVVLSPFFATFTSSGTFYMPPGYLTISVECIGGGGGSGSGMRGATSTNRSGGSAGGGAIKTTTVLPAIAVNTSIVVTVAAGGNGGAAITVNNTDGNTGTVGGTSSFGGYLYAYGGGQGVGGNGGTPAGGGGGGTGYAGTQGSGGGPAGGLTTDVDAIAGRGANSSGSSTAGNAEYGGGAGGGARYDQSRQGGSSLFSCGGGGSGGGISSGNSPSNGSAGGTSRSYALGGGTAANTATGTTNIAGLGNGGGGGDASLTAPISGGTGGIPGGGAGGGGAVENGATSGAGAAGGRGEIRVWGIA